MGSYLEDEERRDGVLGEQFAKGRHGNVEDVLAKVTANGVNLLAGLESLRGLESGQRRSGIARVGDPGE